MICAQQSDYYAALVASDRVSDATAFVEFMLGALRVALHEAVASASYDNTDQVGDPVAGPADQAVARLLAVIAPGETLKAAELMQCLRLSHRPSFRSRYLGPALAAGWIEMTDHDSPRSPMQNYRRTRKRVPR